MKILWEMSQFCNMQSRRLTVTESLKEINGVERLMQKVVIAERNFEKCHNLTAHITQLILDILSGKILK